MELCHGGPIRLVPDAHPVHRIREPGRLILVGPLPDQPDTQFAFDLLPMAVEQVKSCLVLLRIAAAQVEIHPRPVKIGDTLDGKPADAEKAGQRIGGGGVDVAIGAPVQMLLLDLRHGVFPVSSPQGFHRRRP